MNETPVNIEKAIEIAKEYKDLVAEHLPLKALYLYGSYSKGNYTEDSDIDIAVVVERMGDDYFEDAPLLWKLKRKISNLIEPVLLTEDTNNPLYADILKTGILI
ncbi:nucleotidyltransferase domain-containing protein [Bacteroides gallinaceum]|uniref:nucleotidyltransferase domain-containing protein n=1 Tax=Bacteroides gallinaceum TaxID=1462571 RepID=UPI00195B0007|nr:nucleotidyltransferase domain-containing protein [Bacteroides gallinaceum]MBM6719574.1 nucleotidyltransferase domain-containing protein [Bacteroides gallinaceum]